MYTLPVRTFGALAPETRIKEIQEKYQELLNDKGATVFKLVNLQNTLPVIFRHVPTVPEAHYRQIHVLPSMTVRQIIATVTGEMGLKALDSSATSNGGTGLKAKERQLGDDENPFELLMENRELLMNQQIKDYHFVFTVPDSWISKVESVTSRITKGWTARPLSMAVYGLFGATSPTQPTASKEISAPIPMASSSVHHRAFGEVDFSGGDSAKNPKKNRQSMIAGSRLSSFFDPSSLSGWLGSEQPKPQRHSIVFGQSLPNLISKPLGVDNTAGSEFNDMTDEELNVMVENLMKDLNIKDGGTMIQLPREKKITLILQNQQIQNQQLQKQKERVSSPEPQSNAQNGGTTLRTGSTRRVMGSISSTVSFIEPDNSYAAKLHSRYSSWSSIAGSFDNAAEDDSSSPNNAATSERPMSPTAATGGSFLSSLSWFGVTPQPDAQDDELSDDSPQYYIDQLQSKSISQKALTKHLQSLRISLATAKLSWIRQFLDGRGFRALENVLDKTAIKKRGGKPNDLDETLQSECVQCLRVLMNTEPGFNQVLRSPSLVAHISYCLYTTNSKLRTKVAEVLAALCVMSPESHRLVLIALSDFRVAHEERYRFEYLVQTLAAPISDDIDGSDYSESFEWEYKTACLSLMNALANSPASLDDRISLRNELRRRGLVDVFQELKMQSPPESLLIQINVYEDEQHEDWVDLQERAFGMAQIRAGKDSQNSELIEAISALGPDDEELYPHVLRALQQYANAASSSLNQYESDEEDQEEQEEQEEHEKVVPISRQSPQFKEDLWTIVEKFGERVFQMRDIEKDWAGCYDDFLESIQHIVGKRGAILSFSDSNNSSSSATSVLSASLASSRRHSFIDYEMENMRRDMDEMREDTEKLLGELAEARREADEAKAQFQQLQLIKSGPPSSTKESPEPEPLPSFGKRENHAGVVQRLVQKEKEVTQLRETIERMEKKYKDKAELVTDDEPRKSERSKEIDGTRWNAMLTEVQIQKNKTVDATNLADSRQKEIEYLKRALQIVCTRYESAMGERPPPVTDEDQSNQSNQSEGSLQLSKTFEAIARKDEEIIELKEEVDKLRKQSSIGLTPTEEVLSLRGSLKDVMLKVQELQALVADRERTIKGLKENVITMEAAKVNDSKNGNSQQTSGSDSNGATGGRVERSNSRSALKLQFKVLSEKGRHTEELDEEQEDSLNQANTISPSTSETNISNLSIANSDAHRSAGGALSPIGSPTTARRVLGGKRPALPPPPPPPGPKHRLFAANTAATAGVAPPVALSVPPTTTAAQQSIPPPPQASAVQTTVVNTSAPPPPPPPPPPPVATPSSQFTNAAPKQVPPTSPPQVQAPPPPPPPPPPMALSIPINTTLQRSISLPAPRSQSNPSSSPPPPPPPPPMANSRGPPVPTHGLPPPPPPPPPGAQSSATRYDGARPKLPVFLEENRPSNPSNPLQPLAMAIPQSTKPTRPMKQLFWNKLPPGAISQTVWGDICSTSSDVGAVELDYAEIETLFCKNQTITANIAASTEKKKPVSLFSVNRANNIAIMLSRIKLSYPDIRIAMMEISDEKLSIENLKAIKQYVPTSDEIEIVKEYEGDFDSLGNAEKFYREIVDIPRLSERVSAMIFRRRLEIDVSELKPEMDVLRLTIEELQKSRKLKSLLKTVLVMGNHLNATSYRGNAYGFQLEALLKIRDTKGVEGVKPGSNTLLHYLAKSISTKEPELLKFMDELPHLEAAARISVQTLLNSVNSLVAGMNQIREEIRVLRKMRVSPPNDQFIDVMEKFAIVNDDGIKMIVEVGQGLDQDLKKLLLFYGEDPSTTKPEDFFGMLVSFSTMLQKSQLENDALAKKLSKNQQVANKNRRPSEAAGGLSVAAIRDGHLDDAIRGLRSGLRRNRPERPMSHLYSELSLDSLHAINASVPRAGVLSHSRQGSRQ
ncbi:hypothetical protein BGZ76_002926 [Entomortierella beljakovae]|nr:hypothetical protein BGZ76_002926 [Entomortierella beljakovae]